MRDGDEADGAWTCDAPVRRRWVTELQPLEVLAFASALLFAAWRCFGG